MPWPGWGLGSSCSEERKQQLSLDLRLNALKLKPRVTKRSHQTPANTKACPGLDGKTDPTAQLTRLCWLWVSHASVCSRSSRYALTPCPCTPLPSIAQANADSQTLGVPSAARAVPPGPRAMGAVVGNRTWGLGQLLRCTRCTHRLLHLQIFQGQGAERCWAKQSSSGLISLKRHLLGAFQRGEQAGGAGNCRTDGMLEGGRG